MADPSVSFDGTRLDGAGDTPSVATWDDWGADTSPTTETDFVYQGSNSQSNKVSNTTGGVEAEGVTSVDYATTPRVWIPKIMVANYGAIDFTVAKGVMLQMASTGVNDGDDYYSGWYIFGLRTPYPITGGWIIALIDPNIAAYVDESGATGLDETDVVYYGLYADMAGAAKSDNVVIDALDYFNVGDGLTLVGGDGASVDGVFQDFVDFDEGTQNNRYGIISTRGSSALFVLGVLTIGSATETDFTDSDKQIFYPDGRFGAGTVGLDVNLSNASSVISISDCVFVGEGRGAVVADFHTNTDVDGTNEELDIVGHGFQTGDYVDYSKQGGTDAVGLTDGNDYWVEAVTADAISLHTTRANAFTGTTPVDLTASGGTETHRLTKLTDTRPDFEVIGTSGSGSVNGCAFLNHRNITFQSVLSMDGGTLDCQLLTQNSADISNVKILTRSIPGVATLQDPTFGTTTDLHDVDFVQGGQGHAIEIDTATSYTFTNITFSGYNASNGQDDSAIHVSATSGTVTITTSGTTPSYKSAGATVVINTDTTVTFTGLKDNSEVRVYKESDDSVVAGIEDATSGTTDNRSFSWSAPATTLVYYRIICFQPGDEIYEPIEIRNYTVPNNDVSVQINQRRDRNAEN